MFSFTQARFRYEPYPIGIVRPIMEEGRYRQYVESFPPIELFEHLPKFGNKYSLSEKYNSHHYEKFIKSQPLWRDLHAWIKSDAFIDAVDGMLRAHHIDIGLDRHRASGLERTRKALRYLARGRWPCLPPPLRTRFEFSALPADGGEVLPHTDTPRKLVTLIVSMVADGEWKPEYGGGTEVNRAKNVRHAYNWLNRQVPFDEIETLDVFPFEPNQCVVFVKTFNSLHCVRPMTVNGSRALRRTLTINIELDE